MVFLNNKSRHSEWRKVAKKLRRKRIRQEKARKRDDQVLVEQQNLESLPEYQQWLREQERIELEKATEEEIQAAQREEQWKKVEEEAQRQWQELQKKFAQAREEKMKQNIKIKLEWEKEEKRLKEIQIAKEKELEEKRLQQARRERELLDFLEQGGDTPEHLRTEMETNPGKQTCPFFKKVSACRFFDACSRNHVRPGISTTLLITNFFSDMSLEIKENEHGSDSSLEFEKEDTYKNYKEFFDDVVSEFENCGKIRKFVTCCNHEIHLRGNVYVQYYSAREALVAYHKFNGRWYAGKQLNVEFCNIGTWGKAICGLFFKNNCPKGNSCNFLHAFHNPRGLYMRSEPPISRRGSSRNRDRTSKRRRCDTFEDNWSQDSPPSEKRNWRWSESPERVPIRHSFDDSSADTVNRRSEKIGDKYRRRKPNGGISPARSRRKRSLSNSRRRSRSRERRKLSGSSKRWRRSRRASSARQRNSRRSSSGSGQDTDRSSSSK